MYKSLCFCTDGTPVLPQSLLAPVMWPRRDTTEVSLHSTFRLTCRGQAKLTWQSPTELHDETHTEKKGLYISTVSVDNATAGHTGQYSCSYDTGDPDAEKSTIYVYVPGKCSLKAFWLLYILKCTEHGFISLRSKYTVCPIHRLF